MDGSPQCGSLRRNHPYGTWMPQSGRRPPYHSRAKRTRFPGGFPMRNVLFPVAIATMISLSVSTQTLAQETAPPPAAAPAAAAPAAAAKLVGIAAWSQVVGNSITRKEDGKTLTEYYSADGTAKSMTGQRNLQRQMG